MLRKETPIKFMKKRKRKRMSNKGFSMFMIIIGRDQAIPFKTASQNWYVLFCKRLSEVLQYENYLGKAG